MDLSTINFADVERAIIDFALKSVEETHLNHPDKAIYGAIFHCFYGDGDNIYPPVLSIATEELLSRVVSKYVANGSTLDADLVRSLRWSGADLADYMFEEDETLSQLTQTVENLALTYDDFADWNNVYQQYLDCFIPACHQATKILRSKNMVTDDFMVVPYDEGGELLVKCLRQKQLVKYFPEYLD